jgi:pimeloyl-ACP methyl ester carboxylesterase
MDNYSELTAADGLNTIAYTQITGRAPTVLFLHGFRSDMNGTKAKVLADYCRAHGLGYLCFDLRGHGQSSGHYSDFTIGDWLTDVLQVIDTRTQGPLLLVGSSLGAWLALLAIAQRPTRINGLIAIAPAVDFPTRRVLPILEPSQREHYTQKNQLIDPHSGFAEPSVFTRRLIEESAQHNLLATPPRCKGPVRILQGMCDTAVPWQQSVQLLENMEPGDIQLQLFKNGDHRLNEPQQQAALTQALSDILKTF